MDLLDKRKWNKELYSPNFMTTFSNASLNRAVEFDPSSISGLKVWLKADAGITESGGLVSDWADQSVNGNDVVQATGTNQPTFTSSNASINNMPSVDFDGIDNFMDDVAWDSSLSNGFTVYIISDNWFDGGGEAKYAIDADTTRWYLYTTASGYHISSGSELVASGTGTKDVWSYLRLSYHSSTGEIFKDGSSLGTGGTGSGGADGLTLGSRFNQSSVSFGDISIAEILIYDSILSSGDETSLQDDYINPRYGL